MNKEKNEQEGLVTELGRFIHRTSYQDLPSEVTEMAKGRILDALSCSFGGRDFPISLVAVGLAKENSGDCTIFGHKHKAALLDAALTNSVTSHGTSQDDLTAGVAHPASVVVPAAIAVGEQQNASGEEILLAVVLGY